MSLLAEARKRPPAIRAERARARATIVDAADKRAAAARLIADCGGNKGGIRVNTILQAANLDDEKMMRRAGISEGHSEVRCDTLTTLQRRKLLAMLRE